MILKGLVWNPREVATVATSLGLCRGDFYFADTGAAFDVAMYCSVADRPTMYDCYREGVLRDAGLDAGWWGDVSLADSWAADHRKWQTDETRKIPDLLVWQAACSAAKVKYLASRRAVVHAAREAIRDAVGSALTPEEMRRLADEYGDIV